MTTPTPAPAMTAKRLAEIARAITPYPGKELFAYIDALTARVAELERQVVDWTVRTGRQVERADAAEAQLKEAREKALEEAAAICEGQVTNGNYIRWPCWNPNGDLGTHTSEASLAKALAAAIRSLKDTTP